MADDRSPPDADPDPLVDLRVRVRRSFRTTLRRLALDRNQTLQVTAGAMLIRGWRADQRSEKRRTRRQQSLPPARQ